MADCLELKKGSLYMDQIVSYVDSILEPYSRDEQKLITSFMVNNYVKAKIIEAPTLKRYSKNQLSYLVAICLLKQITSMSNLAVLLNKENFQDENGRFYDHFIDVHNEAKKNIYAFHEKQKRNSFVINENIDKTIVQNGIKDSNISDEKKDILKKLFNNFY